MQAFKLREDDPKLLFQLGLDFFSGDRRGCIREGGYALWCFNKVEEVLERATYPDSEKYKEEIDKRKPPLQSFVPEKPK